jgi:hypothetical protein
MDTKLTLSLDKEVIEKAKELANKHDISLSRLIEYMFIKATNCGKNYKSLEDIPVADFISKLAEPEAEYVTAKQRLRQKEEYRTRKN